MPPYSLRHTLRPIRKYQQDVSVVELHWALHLNGTPPQIIWEFRLRLEFSSVPLLADNSMEDPLNTAYPPEWPKFLYCTCNVR